MEYWSGGVQNQKPPIHSFAEFCFATLASLRRSLS